MKDLSYQFFFQDFSTTGFLASYLSLAILLTHFPPLPDVRHFNVDRPQIPKIYTIPKLFLPFPNSQFGRFTSPLLGIPGSREAHVFSPIIFFFGSFTEQFLPCYLRDSRVAHARGFFPFIPISYLVMRMRCEPQNFSKLGCFFLHVALFLSGFR